MLTFIKGLGITQSIYFSFWKVINLKARLVHGGAGTLEVILKKPNPLLTANAAPLETKVTVYILGQYRFLKVTTLIKSR